TFNDLYFPGGGNPDLKPEESENAEFGYKLNFDSLALQVALYNKDIENLIQWAPDATGAWSPANVGKANIQGFELAMEIPLAAAGDLTLAADYLDAIDTTDSANEKPLDYNAKKTLTAAWVKAFSGYEFGLQAKLQSERKVPESSVPSGYSAGYGIVNATFAYQITDQIRFQAKISNIFDKEYTLNPSFNEDGRNWVAGVRATF
ncbi:MAG TPA: TonB-dependent receptor, partial [Marinagarivorans sp.]